MNFDPVIDAAKSKSIGKLQQLAGYLSLTILWGLMGASSSVQAQSLDDFKKASELDGCDSIPYPDIRRRCTDAGVDVYEGCKQVAWNCDSRKYLSSFDTTLKGIDEKVTSLENEIYKLGREADQSKVQDTIKSKQDEIRTLKDRRVQVEEFKKGERKELEFRVAQGKTCAEKRAQVQTYFARTMSDADRESDADIARIVKDTLMDKWKKSYAEHKNQEATVAGGIQKCEDRLR